MSDLPTRSDLFSVGRRSIVNAADKRRINPATVDIPGSDLNLLLGAGANMGEEISARLSKCLKGLFVETSVDSQLDRVAFDRFGLTRKSASPASVSLSLTRPLPGGPTPGTYPAGSRIQTPDGTLFATDSDTVFAPFSTGEVANATALVAGLDGNVAASTLTQFADPPFDSTLTVNNFVGAAGGSEAESNVEFRGRIRNFFPTIRRGTLGALEFGARTVPGVVVATALELVNPFNQIPEAIVELTVADVNGGFSAVMLQRVRDALLDFRALGLPVIVQGGEVVNQIIEWHLTFQFGFDTTQAQDAVRAVTVASTRFLNPGETLFRSSLIAAARTVPGVIVNNNSLVEPIGDVVPTSTQLIRIRSVDVSFV